MNFDEEFKSRIFKSVGGMLGNTSCLSCGQVGIDRLIIHNYNPNQGFFIAWGLEEAEQGYRARSERAEQ